MTDQIKPCPLCGHRSELNHRLGEGWWQVICLTCGCRTGETHKLSAEQVIERWNTRVPAAHEKPAPSFDEFHMEEESVLTGPR